MDRRFLRPAWLIGHLLVVIAVLVCLRLGWWQWNRTHDRDGTVQNLAYAVLWPVFGGAFIFMWLRFLQLELLKDDEEFAAQPDNGAPDAGLRPGLPVDAANSGSWAGSGREALLRGPDGRAEQTEMAAGPGGDDFLASEAGEDANADPPGAELPARPDRRRPPPSRAVTIAVSTVGVDDDDDPELAAYNRALAQLAEKDQRRAR